jgi:hypothetical protein
VAAQVAEYGGLPVKVADVPKLGATGPAGAP